MRSGVTTVLVLLVVVTALAAGCAPGPDALPGSRRGRGRSRRTPSEGPGITVLREAGGKRLIHQAGGDVWIPAQPKRIVAMYLAGDDLLTLGVRPAALGAIWTHELPEYVRRRADTRGIPLVGTTGIGGGTNLEQLWAARPDLIVTAFPAALPELSRVAPTLITSYDALPADTYQHRLLEMGQALGLEEHAQEVLDRHLERVRTTSRALKERLDGRTIAVVRLHARQLRLLGMRHMGLVADTLDLPVDPLVKELIPTDYFDLVSIETLSHLTAGVLVLAVDSVVIGAESTLHDLQESPLYQRIPAVQSGAVIIVDSWPWQVHSVLAAEQIFDDLLAGVPERLPPADEQPE